MSGNYAYAVSYKRDSLTVVDISTPTLPVIVGFVSDPSMDGVCAPASHAALASSRVGGLESGGCPSHG